MSQFTINKWIKPGMYTTLDKFSVVLLGFVNFFILSRILTKSDFGVWVIFTGLVSVIETLREGFIKQPFIALMPAAGNAPERNKIGAASLTLNVAYSLAISLLLIFSGSALEVFWDAQPLAILLKIYAVVNIAFIVFSHFEYLQQIDLDFKGIFVSHLLRSSIPTLLILVMFFFKMTITLPLLAWSLLLGCIVGLISMILFGWRYRHRLLTASKGDLKALLGFGRFSFGTNLASLSMRNMDSWMLGKMLSTESVASYNPAIRISNLVEIPTLTVANLVFPKMAQHYQQKDQSYSTALYEKSVAILVALMLPLAIGMFIFSDQIVYLIAGRNYTDSGYLLKITAFYTLFIPFGRQFGILLDAMRRPNWNFYFVIATAIIGSIITYLSILNWGVAGAAYGTLATYLFRFLVQQWWLFTNFQINTLKVFLSVPGMYINLFKLLKSKFSNYEQKF